MANSKLRVERVTKGLTQFKLRLITGIHQSKISMIENGLIEPNVIEKEMLAKALGTRIENIWGNNGNR